MAITTTTTDLSLDKVLTKMLSSARKLTEKTEREDGDWQVLHSTRSVFYDYRRDLFVLRPKFGHTIAVGTIPERVFGRTSPSDVEERLNGLSRWVARNRVEIINSHNRVGQSLGLSVDGSTELTMDRIANAVMVQPAYRLLSGHYHPDVLTAEDIERFGTYFHDWRKLAETHPELTGLVEDEGISAKLDAVTDGLGDRILEEIVTTRRLGDLYAWTSGYAKILTPDQFLRAASVAVGTPALNLASRAVELYDLSVDDLSAESRAWMQATFDWGMASVDLPSRPSIGYAESMALANLSYVLGGPRLVFNSEADQLYGRSRRFKGYCILTPVLVENNPAYGLSFEQCDPTETLEEIDEDRRGRVFVDAVSPRILELFGIDVRAMGYQVMPEDAKRITDDLWLLPDLS